MNKKVALVNLIEASVLFSDDDKLELISRVPALTDRQTDVLGKYFAVERQFVLDHRDELRRQMETILTELDKGTDTVFVGSGKPT